MFVAVLLWKHKFVVLSSLDIETVVHDLAFFMDLAFVCGDAIVGRKLTQHFFFSVYNKHNTKLKSVQHCINFISYNCFSKCLQFIFPLPTV